MINYLNVASKNTKQKKNALKAKKTQNMQNKILRLVL
jgi:hypothetical protein